MAGYKLTNLAVEDLSRIWNYTLTKWSEKQADIYYYMLIETFKTLASHSDFGKNYSAVVQNLWGFKAGRHIIFYRRMNDNEIEITRILHEQMDLKGRLKEK